MVAMPRVMGPASAARTLRRIAAGAVGRACPGCGSVGRLRLVSEDLEEIPGHWPTIVRAVRCDGCGATVEDRTPMAQR